MPRLLNYVASYRSNETLLLAVVGLCFGVSPLAVKFGYSVALGAFPIGAIIAEARQIGKIEKLSHPVRDLSSEVFSSLLDCWRNVSSPQPQRRCTAYARLIRDLRCNTFRYDHCQPRRTARRLGRLRRRSRCRYHE